MIPNSTKVEKFADLFYEVVGGEEVAAMLNRHHLEGVTYRTLAQEHALSLGTVHRTLARARTRLRRLKLLPAGWDQQPAAARH